MSAAVRPIPVGAILKEAGLTAFVILMLTVVMVGFELRDVPGAIELYTRFPDVLAAVLIAFFGRVAVALLREERPLVPFLGAGAVALAILIGLLAESIFGTATAAQIANRWLPFNAAVLRWCVLIGAVYVIVRALAQLRRGRRRDLSLAAREAAGDRAGRIFQHVALYLGPALLLLAVLAPFLPQWLPFLPFGRGQTLSIGITVLTYIMLGWGLNIVVGLAGLLDLGYVAFYAVGAYTYAIFATTPGLEWSFWLCLPMAGLFAAFAGVLLGFPVLRLRGDYLAIVTLGFGEIVRIVLQNWYSFTNGATGISSIPRPTFFGLVWAEEPPEGEKSFAQFFGLEHDPDYEDMFLYYLIFVLALVVNFFTMRVRRLPVGRAWEALREDEIACRALGINPTNTKLTAFGIGAMFAGFAGSFFASKQGFISPESFTFIESAIILALVVLGGFGSQLGVVLAAVILIILPEVFRELRDFRLIAFGVAMVGIMLWRPSGLLAHREPTLRLHPKGAPIPARKA
jgi:branched-chain amino acid transport system permease protein